MEVNHIIHIGVASSVADVRAAYHLRYQVFSLEQQDYRYADINEETYKDRNDTQEVKIIVAKNTQNQVVGTLRVSLRRETPFIQEELYDFQSLSLQLGYDVEHLKYRTVLLDRGVVHPDYRVQRAKGLKTLGLMGQMVDFSITLCRHLDIDVLLTVISVSSPRVSKMFLRWGWERSEIVSEIGDFKGEVLFKRLAEIKC